MKKIMVIVLSLLLMGCSGSGEGIENEKVNEDLNIEVFGEGIKYNVLRNSFSTMRSMVELDDGIILNLEHEDEATSKQGHYFMYYENGESTIMNSVPSNGCDFDNIEKCTSYFEYEGGLFDDFMYYNNQIYYVNLQFDSSNDASKYYLSRCEIDGTNRERVIELDIMMTSGPAPTFSLHKDKFYVTDKKKLYIYNLANDQNEIIEFEQIGTISKTFLYEDIAYIEADNYKYDDGTRVKNALIKMDLNTFEQEVMYENIPMYFFDETNFISVDKNGEEVKTYLQNHETGDKVILMDGYATYRLKENGKYILGGTEPKSGSFVRVFDEQGNLLKETMFEDGHTGHGVVDGKYYITIKNRELGKHEWFYLDINSESDELVQIIFE